MPIYDYKCQQHGVFHELIAINEESNTHPCPSCERPAPRVIMMSPQILSMDPATRTAHSINEKNAHQPVISSVISRDHQHGRGCGCEKSQSLRSQAVLLADGSKVFPSSRPWMISH